MLTTQRNIISSYIDNIISLINQEINTAQLFIKYGPQNIIIDTNQITKLRDTILRKKRKLVLDSEIILLSVIDHMQHDQLEEVTKACTILCIESLIPEKYLLFMRQPNLETHIKTIIHHLDFVDTMSWFVS